MNVIKKRIETNIRGRGENKRYNNPFALTKGDNEVGFSYFFSLPCINSIQSQDQRDFDTQQTLPGQLYVCHISNNRLEGFNCLFIYGYTRWTSAVPDYRIPNKNILHRERGKQTLTCEVYLVFILHE